MPLQFITGRCGSGKTFYCLEQMKKLSDNNINAVLIVPEQLSLSSEHEAIEHLKYLDNTKNIFSFNRLFHSLYNKYIHKTRHQISNIGKSILMSKVVYSHRQNLKIYASAAERADNSAGLLATITEFKRYGYTYEQLKEESKKIPDGITKLKIQDLILLYENYEKLLANIAFDADDNLTVLEKIIPDCPIVSETVYFIDGFEGFTPNEIKIIHTLNNYAKKVYITLSTDSSSANYVFAPANETKRKICEFISPEKDIQLKGNHKHQNDELKFLEQNYGTYSKNKFESPTNHITAFVSDNQYAEVDMCARDILKHIKNGYKFSDIAVVFGDANSYIPIISDSFERHQISYFADKKRSIISHPLCVFMLSLCDIFIDNFSYESVFSFLKTGYTPINFEDICLLENYVLASGIKGRKWLEEWTFNHGNDDLDKLNSTRTQLLEIVTPFRNATKGKSKCSEYVLAAKNLLETLKIPDIIANKTADLITSGENTIAIEYRQIFNMLVTCLNEMTICMDDLSFGIERFRNYLKSGLSECEVGIIPPSVNNVICGSISRTRLKKIKILYILGLNDGLIPPIISGTGIISDTERRTLDKSGIKLAQDNKKKALELPYMMYRTLTTPSEQLILSYSLSSSDGEILRPSNVLNNIKYMFPQLNEVSSISCPLTDLVSVPEATLINVIQNQSAEEYEQVISWFSQNEEYKQKIDYVLSAKTYNLSAKLSEELISRIWGDEINTTVSRLESFAKCPFSYFMKYGLGVFPKKLYSFDSPDAGTFLHKILEDYSTYITINNIDWNSITKDKCYSKTLELSSAALNEVLTKLPVLSKRYEFAIEKLKNAACAATWAVVHHINSGVFTPYTAELDLSENELVPPLVHDTPQGRKMTLYGKIDRVDTGEGYFRIIDYKSGAHDIDISKVYQGFSLQLFVYSAALKDKLGKPGGMFYLAITNPVIEHSGDITPAEAENKIMKEFKLAGYMVGEDSEDTIAKNHKEFSGFSDVISARATKAGYTTQRFLTSDEYNFITEKVLERCGEFSDRILNGNFEVSPLIDSGVSPCEFCDYSICCGFDLKQDCARYVKKLTKDEIFSELYDNGGNVNE